MRGGVASLAIFAIAACGEKLQDNSGEEKPSEVKVSVEFALSEVSVPVNGTETVEITVTPAERAGEVVVAVADESVVSIESQTTTQKGLSLSLKPLKLSSTTIYAIHDDLDSPAECAVTVTPVGVESISLDKTSLELKVYDTYSLSPTINPADATSPTITWKSDNEEVATVEGGKVTAVSEGEATITASCNGKTATCTVSVAAIRAESLGLYCDGAALTEKTIYVDESFRADATILPADVTYKTVDSWTVENTAVLKCEPLTVDGNCEAAYFTALSEGSTTVTATINSGVDGKPVTASFTVEVKPLTPPVDPPKIGDYFYSDGTWSDGGLVSISSDGTSAVWRTGDERPAPEEGKTVIGIVFQTDTTRISATERALGYNHGLVLSLKRAYKPIAQKDPNNKYETPDSLTKFTTLSELNLSCVKRGKLATSYYSDINGYSATKGICDKYSGDQIEQFPAIDWTTRGFTAAPANTSGWYLPASGQVWDLLANLGGEELAQFLSVLSGYEGDISYYSGNGATNGSIDLTSDPIAELNSHWSKVPSTMKENMNGDRDRDGFSYFYFLCCGQYDTECCRVFWLGSAKDKTAEKQGQFAGYLTYLDDAVTCYPVLSF